MRKAITMIVVLALGVSLWAESSPTRPSKNDVEIRFPDRRPSDDRTETYELYMVDSYGDGWNGASLDLFVNETLVGDDLTIEDGSEGSFTFDVEDGDIVSTTWSPGTYDGECAYAFYNAEGELVAESDFDLLCTFTVDLTPPVLVLAGVLDLTVPEGGSSGKGLLLHAIEDIADLSIYGVGVANLSLIHISEPTRPY